MFSLIYALINGWVNTGEAGDLRRHLGHYDVSVMEYNSNWKDGLWLFTLWHLNSPAIGIRDDNGGDGGGLLIPVLYRYLTSPEWLEYIIPLRHMNCLRGGRMVVRACQFDSHRRLWWRRAVVAAAFIFPRPVKLITDFIEFYNIYITIRTERTCWKCLDSRYMKIRSIVLVLMTHLF